MTDDRTTDDPTTDDPTTDDPTTDDPTTDDPTTDDPTTDDPTTDDPTTGYRTYLGDLERALRSRGLDPARTADVIGEMSDHLAESGERPLEAFGDPDRYAAELLATDDPDQPGPDQPGPDQPGPDQLSGLDQPSASDADGRYEQRTFRATAADEMAILADLGGDGWELTGVRDFGLHARRPVADGRRREWEYARRTALRRGPVLAQMEAEAWTPCGRWLTFHYFKRVVAASVGQASA